MNGEAGRTRSGDGPRTWLTGGAEFDEARRELRVGGEPRAVEGKPLAPFQEPLCRGGDVATKRELMQAVWPGVAVVEHALPAALAAYRAALPLYAGVAAADPISAAHQADLADIDGCIGKTEATLGDGAAAETDERAGIAIVERLAHDSPNDIDLGQQLVTLRIELATALLAGSDRRAAAPPAAAALAAAGALATIRAGDRELARLLGTARALVDRIGPS